MALTQQFVFRRGRKGGSREVGSKGGSHLALSISKITGSSDPAGWEPGSAGAGVI